MSVVISIADRQKRYSEDHAEPYTGAWLKAQARRCRMKSGKQLSLHEFVEHLPGMLDGILEMAMDDIDYGEMRNSELVKAMRCLAMVVVCLEEVIEEPARTPGGCGCRPAEAAVDEQSLKAAMQASRLLGERRSGLFGAIREVKRATALLNESYLAIHDVMMDLPLHVDNIAPRR